MPYVVLLILLIERACTAVHNQHNTKPLFLKKVRESTIFVKIDTKTS